MVSIGFWSKSCLAIQSTLTNDHRLKPFLHEVSTPNSLNTSAKMFYDYVLKSETAQTPPAPFWIDVRDVAIAHVRAIALEKSGGERFIISSGQYFFLDIIMNVCLIEGSLRRIYLSRFW